jgi:hypothetical protein
MNTQEYVTPTEAKLVEELNEMRISGRYTDHQLKRYEEYTRKTWGFNRDCLNDVVGECFKTAFNPILKRINYSSIILGIAVGVVIGLVTR